MTTGCQHTQPKWETERIGDPSLWRWHLIHSLINVTDQRQSNTDEGSQWIMTWPLGSGSVNQGASRPQSTSKWWSQQGSPVLETGCIPPKSRLHLSWKQVVLIMGNGCIHLGNKQVVPFLETLYLSCKENAVAVEMDLMYLGNRLHL